MMFLLVGNLKVMEGSMQFVILILIPCNQGAQHRPPYTRVVWLSSTNMTVPSKKITSFRNILFAINNLIRQLQSKTYQIHYFPLKKKTWDHEITHRILAEPRIIYIKNPQQITKMRANSQLKDMHNPEYIYICYTYRSWKNMPPPF